MTWKRSNIVPIPNLVTKQVRQTSYSLRTSLFASNIEQTSGEAYCEPLVTTSDGDAANLWFTLEFSEGKVNSNSLTGDTHNWFEMLERGKEVGAVVVVFF